MKSHKRDHISHQRSRDDLIPEHPPLLGVGGDQQNARDGEPVERRAGDIGACPVQLGGKGMRSAKLIKEEVGALVRKMQLQENKQ